MRLLPFGLDLADDTCRKIPTLDESIIASQIETDASDLYFFLAFGRAHLCLQDSVVPHVQCPARPLLWTSRGALGQPCLVSQRVGRRRVVGGRGIQRPSLAHDLSKKRKKVGNKVGSAKTLTSAWSINTDAAVPIGVILDFKLLSGCRCMMREREYVYSYFVDYGLCRSTVVKTSFILCGSHAKGDVILTYNHND